jgi:hypothetical protein
MNIRLIIGVVGIVSCVQSAGIQAQSLVDVAKKTVTQRHDDKRPAKSYSNTDLPSLTPEDPPIVAATTSDSSPVTPAKDAIPATSSKASGKESSESESKTTLEAMREKASTTFSARLSSLSEKMSTTFEQLRRYQTACTGYSRGDSSTLYASGRQTFGSVSIANDTTPECRALDSDIGRNGSAIHREFDDISETGRRLGFYSGVMRELFERTLPKGFETFTK